MESHPIVPLWPIYFTDHKVLVVDSFYSVRQNFFHFAGLMLFCCVGTPYFFVSIHWSMDLSCFPLLAIVNHTVISVSGQASVWAHFISQCRQPMVELLHHVVIIHSYFRGTAILFCSNGLIICVSQLCVVGTNCPRGRRLTQERFILAHGFRGVYP